MFVSMYVHTFILIYRVAPINKDRFRGCVQLKSQGGEEALCDEPEWMPSVSSLRRGTLCRDRQEALGAEFVCLNPGVWGEIRSVLTFTSLFGNFMA